MCTYVELVRDVKIRCIAIVTFPDGVFQNRFLFLQIALEGDTVVTAPSPPVMLLGQLQENNNNNKLGIFTQEEEGRKKMEFLFFASPKKNLKQKKNNIQSFLFRSTSSSKRLYSSNTL